MFSKERQWAPVFGRLELHYGLISRRIFVDPAWAPKGCRVRHDYVREPVELFLHHFVSKYDRLVQTGQNPLSGAAPTEVRHTQS